MAGGPRLPVTNEMMMKIRAQSDKKLFVGCTALRRNQMVEQFHGGNRTGEMILHVVRKVLCIHILGEG
jgi:hypothetical protein